MTTRDFAVYGLAGKTTEELRARERQLTGKRRLSRAEHNELHLIWSALATKRVQAA